MPEEEEVQEEEKTAKKPNPFMMMIIGMAGMLIVSIIAFVVVFKVVAPAQNEEKKVATEAAVDNEMYYGKLYALENPIIVNLAESKGQRYLKVAVQFEVSNEPVMAELKNRHANILDLLIGILSSKTINDVENTVGRNRLRGEMIDKLNALLVSGRIINVYFTEFVVQ